MSCLISDWSSRERIDKLVDERNDCRGESLPKNIQASLLEVAESSLYYQMQPVSHKTLEIKNQIDEIYTKYPYYGSRRIAKQLTKLRKEPVNRKRIQAYMRQMGIAAIFPSRKTSTPDSRHQVYPYLLKGIKAHSPNHIWSTDITYIRMSKGFIYLTAFLDWFSRFVLSYAFSTTLDSEFVIACAKSALYKYGDPDYANSDRGAQMTSAAYLSVWNQDKTKISMDSKGRCLDNIFVERLWRTIKYEEVYLHSYESVKQAISSISTYIEFYNHQRLHQSLGYKTPASVYFSSERNIP